MANNKWRNLPTGKDKPIVEEEREERVEHENAK
jgi:hypothetical protein